MSFYGKVTFSMVASREKQHGERIPKIEKYQTRILPIAAIYGGNAAGKTNFFKAISFAKKMIVKGTGPESIITVQPFRLDSNAIDKPSYFSFELLIDEAIYEFSFSVTAHKVLQEKLVKVNSASEKTLYERNENKISFDKSLNEDQFLKFAFKGTRDNQLFLTNSISQKVENFRPVYDWFKDTLELVAPDSRFQSFDQFLNEDSHLYCTMNKIIPLLDTGFTRLGSEEIPLENIPWPEFLKKRMQEDLREGVSAKLHISGERFVVSRKNGELVAKKLVTYHPHSDGTETKFEIHDESDGTQRVIDLLPAFLELSAATSKKVYVIDEVDRSLHTLLTRQLLEEYLTNSHENSRSQLLLTTHDALLMDQDLLRRDEMWVVERNNNGSSSLLSFSEFKDVRYDKDLRKSYLQGRLGGIPRILLKGALFNSNPVVEQTTN